VAKLTHEISSCLFSRHTAPPLFGSIFTTIQLVPLADPHSLLLALSITRIALIFIYGLIANVIRFCIRVSDATISCYILGTSCNDASTRYVKTISNKRQSRFAVFVEFQLIWVMSILVSSSNNFIGPRLHRLPQRLDYTLIPAPLGAFFSLRFVEPTVDASIT